MASTYSDRFDGTARRGGIDLPVAALAALSVGFVAFAMPGDLFAGAISATGLASVLPAAAPPLGMTARVVVAALAATATFGIVLALLRLLDGRPAEPARAPFRAREFVLEDPEPDLPRLRRADCHPDAPARRPILAARELGEPDFAPRPQAPRPAAAEEAVREPAAEDEIPLPPPAAAAPLSAAAPAAAQAACADSIPDLVARLERGLGRRQRPTPAKATAPAPGPAAAAQPAPAKAPATAGRDDRLKSAIENLQRLAGRG